MLERNSRRNKNADLLRPISLSALFDKDRRLFALAILCLFLISMCGPGQSKCPRYTAKRQSPPERVILILVDTLRPDSLSCYGNQRISTPHIDQLAEEGVLFERAFSAGPWTSPSVASFLTGISPLAHKVTHANSLLPMSLKTLAEYMSEAGYLTCAIGANPYLSRKSFLQGFIDYDFFSKGRRLSSRPKTSPSPIRRARGMPTTSELTLLTIDWLDSNADSNFFLWVHYYDPHGPYEPPAKYIPKGREPVESVGMKFSCEGKVREGELKLTEEEIDWVRTLYEAEVSYVDANVGIILDHLRRLNIYDDSLIILTSDHGEEFFEHGSCDHGHSLYNELLWVPLIFKLPRASFKGTTVNKRLSIESLMATILDLCKIEYQHQDISRGSITSAWLDPSKLPDDEPIISTGLLFSEDRESVVFHNKKYIRFLESDAEEFYNLADDPGEKNNLIQISQTEVEKAKEIISEHRKAAKKLSVFYSIEEVIDKKLDQKMIQELRSLGYIR
jgi:arylsulfatase